MAKSARYKAPLSGPIIGSIVKELRIENDSLARRTARRYFRGQRIKDAEKSEVFNAIGEALTEDGIIPESPFLKQGGIPLQNVISFGIAWYAGQWDQLVGDMRTTSAPVDRPDLAATSYLRLVVIDFALRASAVLWLAELPTPHEGTPLWAKNGGGAEYLKHLLDRCGASRPTREQFAEQLGVSDNTVDSWLDANIRPSRANIDRISEALAPCIDDLGVESLKRQLHRHYTLCALGDLLANRIGRDEVVDLATALIRFTSRNLAGLRQFSQLPPYEAAMHQLLILTFGVRFIASKHLLNALWRQERDPVWQADLAAAFKPWELRLRHVARHLGRLDEVIQRVHDEFGIPKDEAESTLDQILGDVQADMTRLPIRDPSEMESGTFVRITGDAKYSARNRIIQAAQAQSEGDYETAIVHLRRAVELQPEDAEYHFQLGATLGMAGQVEEGIQECWIAAQLDDTSELPQVEVGIILLNADRDQEARNHLESLARDHDEPSSHLAFNLGVARLRSGDPAGALDMLDKVIKKQPDHGMALDCAAQAAFVTGDRKTGVRLAKRADNLGYSETYREWRQGKYRARNNR